MSIEELRYIVASLEKQNRNLILAIAVLAERLRQLDHVLNLGTLPERLPIGFFDLVADCDEQQPPLLNLTAAVEGTNVRVRFNNGIDKHEAEQ